MKTLDDAQKLGDLLKQVGELHGLKVSICITDMNQPLGNYSGIASEISESIDALKGNGPSDLMEIVFYLVQSLRALRRIRIGEVILTAML